MAFYKGGTGLATNEHGFFCEDCLKKLIPLMGISHRWSTSFEDHALKLDDWLLIGRIWVAVDFTVISNRKPVEQREKLLLALGRGVVPVFLEQGMIMRASDGSHWALDELSQEIRLQVEIRLPLLNGNRMTREKATRLAAARR